MRKKAFINPPYIYRKV